MDIEVKFDGAEIIITKPGTDFMLAYRKRPDSPTLKLTRSWVDPHITSPAISDSRAHAFQAAVSKAREIKQKPRCGGGRGFARDTFSLIGRSVGGHATKRGLGVGLLGYQTREAKRGSFCTKPGSGDATGSLSAWGLIASGWISANQRTGGDYNPR
jgi:hypothetical protein